MEQSGPPQKGDWKLLPEIPSAEEILQPKRDPSLPQNPVDTPWASKEEYFSTQYRLLRCEATEPLRFSVRSFVEASFRRQELWDDDNTWVYPNVRVTGYLMSGVGPVARVEFGTRSQHKIDWEKSKRLRPGQIVALSTSRDGFKTVCKLATIAQRPYFGGLDQDPPVVDILWANTGDAVLNPSEDLVMVESHHGFFEATRHALVGLQLSAETPSPLDKYLLGHATDTGPIIAASQQTGASTNEGPITLPSTPQLDESQTEALNRMLSSEFAIIQGPPGTGKTFTSVAAIAAMAALRRKNGGPPLVVAAQTNDALDHILVKCINAGIRVLRVGGRSSDTRIQEVSLFNLRRQNKKLVAEGNRARKDVDAARKRNICQIQDFIATIFGRKLLNPKALLDWGLITSEQYQSLEDDTTEVDASLQDMGPFGLWLGDSLIPAKILRKRHPILSGPGPAPPEEDEVDDGEIPHVDEDQEERDRLQGTFLPLHHIWTGKEPASWTGNMVAHRELRAPDLFTIRPELRGAVYQHLQSRFLAMIQPRFVQLLEESVILCKRARDLKTQQDATVIELSKDVDVVGCTTTGLTKYRQLFCHISPKALLIEEAAETIEAHIVSALYPSLGQLILVGDHQQLAPSCAVQWLKKHPFNLTVSLFQRMVNLGMEYTMLKRQRRMTPELRMILSPFYPDLLDDPNVGGADIPGMGGVNSWFFHHDWPEESNAEHSKFNEQEAQMVVNFYAYLVANKTPSSQITILTFYVGQRKLLLRKLRRHPSLAAQSFNVCTVDSYQGKENDIVLLSLVRSPGLDSGPAVGFLEDKRRVVVAISRARRGFYMFGNVENAVKAGPTTDNTWAKIWDVLDGQDRVNPEWGLPLTCQNHSETTWIFDNEDWADNSGGCNMRCQEIRPCGHFCTLKCHRQVTDSDMVSRS